jgi:flagellar hook-associated protein 1 FlgK
MSLNGALQIGRTALTTSQTALQVAGNNMANAATEGYSRRSIHLSPLPGETAGRGHFVGRGVQIDAIRREVDTALQARFRDSISEEGAAAARHRYLSSVETIQGELTENDLSTLLSELFNSFSELANSPSDNAVRAVVIQQGQTVANRVADLRRDYTELVNEVDRQLDAAVTQVNDLLGQIEDLNTRIVLSENGVGEANALRDQRDRALDELATYLDVDVVEAESGTVDVLINSVPIVLAGKSRGVEVRTESVAGELEVTLRVLDDGTEINTQNGKIGGLLQQRDETTSLPVVQTLEDLATNLIHQINLVHGGGQGLKGFGSVTGTYTVDDSTANLNTPDIGLPFRIENGSFFVHVTHGDTGQRVSARIDVDGDAMSMDDLINEINVVVGVPNTTASLTVEGALSLSADAGYEISFSDDTAGALAALGINTFFTGDSASTIEMNDRLLDDPTLLAAGAGHVPGSNGTALALANLQDEPVDALGGVSLRSHWQNAVNALAVETDAAGAATESARLVRESLFTQMQAVSGVSLDEESINLLTFQRQFQAAARFITVIDEALQTLLSIA